MKSRLVALALAAVMTLGSCMTASAKPVFTKGMIGATEVKNGSYVRSIDLIDVEIYDNAVESSFWASLAKMVNSDDWKWVAGNAKASPNFVERALGSLSTADQAKLLTLVQVYGQGFAKSLPVDTDVAARWSAGWSYDEWVATMQIAPYAERYIVAMNYKQLYKKLAELAKYAVAQGQITVSNAYADTNKFASAKSAFDCLDVEVVLEAGNTTLSNATFRVGGAQVLDSKTIATPGDNGVTFPYGGKTYNVYAVAGDAVDTQVVRYNTNYGVYGYKFIAMADGQTSSDIQFYTTTGIKKIAKGTAFIADTATATGVIAKDTTVTAAQLAGGNAKYQLGWSPLEVLRASVAYTSKTYQEDADNALAIAKDMLANYTTAQKYYEGQEKEGLVYLIQNVRPDLASVTVDNVKSYKGFDLDPFNELKWNLNETKTIAFTSPTITENMKNTDSAVVLHFNTTACKWEAIDAHFVQYDGILGIEGGFTSASPVIVVALKDFVDNGAAAAATATDAKKSPTTGENF